MIKELKNCPFCRSNDCKVFEWMSGAFSVECDECNATIDDNFNTKEKAVIAWNTRPQLSDNALVEALEDIQNQKKDLWEAFASAKDKKVKRIIGYIFGVVKQALSTHKERSCDELD